MYAVQGRYEMIVCDYRRLADFRAFGRKLGFGKRNQSHLGGLPSESEPVDAAAKVASSSRLLVFVPVILTRPRWKNIKERVET